MEKGTIVGFSSLCGPLLALERGACPEDPPRQESTGRQGPRKLHLRSRGSKSPGPAACLLSLVQEIRAKSQEPTLTEHASGSRAQAVTWGRVCVRGRGCSASGGRRLRAQRGDPR